MEYFAKASHSEMLIHSVTQPGKTAQPLREWIGHDKQLKTDLSISAQRSKKNHWNHWYWCNWQSMNHQYLEIDCKNSFLSWAVNEGGDTWQSWDNNYLTLTGPASLTQATKDCVLIISNFLKNIDCNRKPTTSDMKPYEIKRYWYIIISTFITRCKLS